MGNPGIHLTDDKRQKGCTKENNQEEFRIVALHTFFKRNVPSSFHFLPVVGGVIGTAATGSC